MDSKIALDKIKEAEVKAKEIVEQAKTESLRILHDARVEKERIIKRAQEEAGLDAQKLKDRILEEVSRETASIRNQGQEEIKALKEKAQANLDKAVEFIRNKIS